jgi:uncharacterized membrane protein YbhN (UPF0104 family)/tRNA A-37 threonylcarbamoyl transferase component Bud32
MNVWSSEADDPRVRRPTDGALLAVAAIVLGIVLLVIPGSGPTGRAVEAFLRSMTFLGHVWWTLEVIAMVGVMALVVLTVVRGRWMLCRDLLIGGVAAAAVMIVLHHLFVTPADAVVESVLPHGAKPLPVVRLAIIATAFAVASPFIIRPLRYLSHVLLGSVVVATIALAGTNVNGVLVGLCVGWIAATSVHLVFGSPGGRPSLDRVMSSLQAVDLELGDLGPVTLRSDGVAELHGRNVHGPVVVKFFGRDAWSGQLFAAIWRFITHRGPGATLAVTRLQQAEHEALVALVADRRGVGVPVPVTIAKAPNSDVILASEVRSTAALASTTRSTIDALWDLLAGLHRAGVAHRAIAPQQLGVDDNGAVAFLDMSRAVLASDHRSQLVDRAQLLASTIVLSDVETAIDAFLTHDRDDATAMLRYLQPAVMRSSLRRRLKESDVDLTAVRTIIAERIDEKVPELEKVRRVSRGAILMTLVIGIAAMFVVSTFSNLDWSEIRSAVDDANWWWLVFAFVMAQAPRLGGSLSMMGACRTPLPYGPVVLLQFALPFIDVAAPAAAGRIAATMRFQQRYGVPAAAAFSASIIDSGVSFAAQILLMAILFTFTSLNLSSLGGDRFDVDFRLLLIIAIGAAFIVGVMLAIPAIRRRLKGPARDIWSAMAVLKTPSKFALLLGGSALSEMLYAVAMGLCLRSLGLDMPYTSILIVTLFVRFVSGISPIPGGLGIAEAGLTAGLVSIGVPVEFAFSAAMIYRLCTFYVPPAYGWAVLGVLRKKEYL